MTRATIALGVALLLLSSAVVRAQSAVAPPDGFPAVGQPPNVVVISTGGEPRRALRYTVPADYRGHMNMDMTMGAAIGIADQSLPLMESPLVRAGAEVAVTSVSASGDISYSMVYTGLSLLIPTQDPAAFDALNADLRSIIGTATITNRGLSSAMIFDTSRITNPQYKQVMDSLRVSMFNLSLALPEEALGVGARWQLRQAAGASDVAAFQTIECHLTALDDTSATVETRTTQTAPPQAMNIPGFPPGAQAMLESMSGGGTGTMRITFGALVPVSEASTKTTMVVSVTMSGETQRLTLDYTMDARISPASR